MSPSVTQTSSPMMGFGSLLVTGLPRERLTVPFGTKKGGRGLSSYFSRCGWGSIRLIGPTVKRVRGNSISRGTMRSTWSCGVP